MNFFFLHICFFTYTLSATRVLNSREELFKFEYETADNSQLACSTHWERNHLQRDCIVVLRLFRVARNARCFRRGSKPGWLFVWSDNLPQSYRYSGRKRTIFFAYMFVYIYTPSASRALKWLEKSFVFMRRRQPAIPHPRAQLTAYE